MGASSWIPGTRTGRRQTKTRTIFADLREIKENNIPVLILRDPKTNGVTLCQMAKDSWSIQDSFFVEEIDPKKGIVTLGNALRNKRHTFFCREVTLLHSP